MTSPQFALSICSLGCAIVGAIWDVRTRRIPNWLTGPALLLGVLLHLAFFGWMSFFAAIVGGLLAGFAFFLFYLAGGMGAGDVKLIAAVCAIAGLSKTTEILVATALSGGVMAVVLAAYRRRLGRTLVNVAIVMTHHASVGLIPHTELNVTNAETIRLPYGLAIAAGAGLSLLAGLR